MSEDIVTIESLGRPTGMLAGQPERFLIEVHPRGPGVPVLPFLHCGDFFQDVEGAEYHVLKAVQRVSAMGPRVYVWMYTTELIWKDEGEPWD